MNGRFAEIIGTRMRQKREEAGISQKGLAEKVGISPSAINQFEKGEKKPSSPVLAAIAEALGVSTDYLLGASEKDNIFFSDNVAAAFRDFKKLNKPDREIILKNIKFLKSQTKPKGKQK